MVFYLFDKYLNNGINYMPIDHKLWNDFSPTIDYDENVIQ